VTGPDINALLERLVGLLGSRDFLEMRGLANEVPIFIQTYAPAQEDAVRRMVENLATRLRGAGVAVTTLDFFELVLQELEAHDVLDALLAGEAEWERTDVLETLQNYSDPERHLVPRLVKAIGGEQTQLTLITGAGRVYPFLRTHTILESLQPKMLNHPVVIFFPGEYAQDPNGGSHLRLFGSVPSPAIHNPYYRAMNLDHHRG
jgi:hypothetical protein